METDTPMFSTDRRATMRIVADTFAAWKAASDSIELLEAKIELHPDVATPALVQMHSELRQLRLEAEGLLAKAQQALLAVKTPRVSQVDPTHY